MALELDARQRAMLAEMGVRLFDAPSGAGPEVQGAAAAGLSQARRRPDAHADGSAAEAMTAPDAARPLRMPQGGAVGASRPLAADEAGATVTAGAADGAEPQAPAVAPACSADTAGGAPAPAEAEAATVGTASLAQLDWSGLEQAVAGCRACGLCEGRRKVVFGAGDRTADWLVVGDAPDEREDLLGEPFAGNDGVLLDNMLAALGVSRERGAYLTNVLKCRPPGNRMPEPAEVAACEPFLRRQVELLQPKVILAMGRFAPQVLAGSAEPLGRLRGQVHRYAGIPVVTTYHPSYLLRNLPDKARSWSDLCLAYSVVPGGEH
ncbi:uracil-DNA glycosylase [Ramlibacter sp. AN1015]|uniref:uracil-DNA glycosylase n=1 Tax=Ramlibacter sp. AN1015 TaxID=3133428 RepID=UPI0030BF2323